MPTRTEPMELGEEIRASIARQRQERPNATFVTGGARSWEVEDGHIASGRASCLCCGKRIAKGEPCLRAVDVGGELWTARVRFLHASDCRSLLNPQTEK